MAERYRIVKKDQNGSDHVFEGMKFDVTENTRFVFPIVIHDMRPEQVDSYLQLVREIVSDFFKPGQVLYIPIRKAEDFSLYELVEEK